MGSALARVRWELDLNRRWERDPTFYLDQTLTALLESLVNLRPLMRREPAKLWRVCRTCRRFWDGEANLHAVRPFAQWRWIRCNRYGPSCWRWNARLRRCCSGAGCNPETHCRIPGGDRKSDRRVGSLSRVAAGAFQKMPENAAVGRTNYEFFLSHVALIPYTPEQLLAISRQEWERAVTFEQIEKQRNQGLPELKIAANIDEQIRTAEREELEIRNLLKTREF